jgi:hypothetical protein
MGAPLDYDGDGWVDILSGSDDRGTWNLFRNQGGTNQSLTIRIGSSPDGVDAHGAEVTLFSTSGSQFKRVGSAGAVHSQGINNLVHFGLAHDKAADRIQVRWRDGYEVMLTGIAADSTYDVGLFPAQD